MKEVTIEELKNWPRDSYELIDIRDDGLVAYGMIPGAVKVSINELMEGSGLNALDDKKKLVFYCQIGRKSRELDDVETLEGKDIYSLEGGYIGYIRAGLSDDTAIVERQKN